MKRFFVLSGLVVPMSMAVPPMLPAQTALHDSASARLAPGDVLRITVWRKPEFSGEFTVAPDGSITHPLYRELRVTGISFDAVEDLLRRFLTRFETNPSFVMSPLLRVFVGGEVRQPSVYTLPPRTTVAQAVALAGGATERGTLDEVRLRRQNSVVTIDLTQPNMDAALTEIRSGDQILVGRSRSFFRDYVGPTGSVVAALAAVASVVIQAGRR